MADRKIFVSGDLTSDDKFKEAIEQVEKKGFIPSHRTGDTGVGKTLEDELGVEENSVQAADLGEVELKATRRVQSAVTNGHWCGGKRPQCGASAVGLS